MVLNTHERTSALADTAAPRKAWSRPTLNVAKVAEITASTPFGAESDGNISTAFSPYS